MDTNTPGTIFIFRTAKTAKPKAATVKAFLAAVSLKVATKAIKADRPEVTAFLADGFHRLPIVPRATIKNPGAAALRLADAWEVPASDLGGGTITGSIRNSLDAWVKAHCGDVVDRESVGFVFIPADRLAAIRAAGY